MPISPWIFLFLIPADLILWIFVPMPKMLKILFILTRFYFLIFYALVTFGIVSEFNMVITLGRFATFFLFFAEVVAMLVVILGDRNVPK